MVQELLENHFMINPIFFRLIFDVQNKCRQGVILLLPEQKTGRVGSKKYHDYKNRKVVEKCKNLLISSRLPTHVGTWGNVLAMFQQRHQRRARMIGSIFRAISYSFLRRKLCRSHLIGSLSNFQTSVSCSVPSMWDNCILAG